MLGRGGRVWAGEGEEGREEGRKSKDKKINKEGRKLCRFVEE